MLMEKTDAEVLALVVGVKVSEAKKMLALAGGLSGLQGYNRQGFKLTEKQDDRLTAFFALEARHLGEQMKGKDVIREPESVLTYFKGTIRDLKRETFRVILLDKGHAVIKEVSLGEGTVDQMAIHPREVLRHVINADASAVILAHNHPSGRVDPSREDRELTAKLKTVLNEIGVAVLDHLIIAQGAYYSFREHGLFGRVNDNPGNQKAQYEERVKMYEAEGFTRSDAQGIVDAELMTEERRIGTHLDDYNLTQSFRASELSQLDRTPSQYKPSIQIHDGKGNKTKFISISYEELNQIVRILAPGKKWGA